MSLKAGSPVQIKSSETSNVFTFRRLNVFYDVPNFTGTELDSPTMFHGCILEDFQALSPQPSLDALS